MNPLIRIEKPCKEPLEKMHDISGGKFCNLCSKRVLDISNMSDSEVSEIIQHKKNEKFCGITMKQQLNRPLFVNKLRPQENYSKKTTFSKIAIGATIAISTVNSYQAQTKNHTKTEITTGRISSQIQNKKKEEQKKIEDGNILISGRVIDKKTGQTVSKTKVDFITIKKIYSTITDSNGNYNLKIPTEIINQENLLLFSPSETSFSPELMILKKENLFKKNTVRLSEDEFSKQYGEISFIFPTEQSLVFLEGKKIDHKIFNKSFSIYEDRYRLYYIPKPYSTALIKDENINDIFITFIN